MRRRAPAFETVVAEALDRCQEMKRTWPRSTSACTLPASRSITLTEGEISDLHVGLKGTMNAPYLKDLADATTINGNRLHTAAMHSRQSCSTV
jgi:site-specific DNA recombinase